MMGFLYWQCDFYLKTYQVNYIYRLKYQASFSQCHVMHEVCPYHYFCWCGYFQGLFVSFVRTEKFSVNVTKITSKIKVSLYLTANLSDFVLLFWLSKRAVLPKGCKPNIFESHNSLNFRFTNIWGLCSNCIDCEFFLELNSSDIFALFETYLKGLSLFNSLLLIYIVLQFVLFWWNW